MKTIDATTALWLAGVRHRPTLTPTRDASCTCMALSANRRWQSCSTRSWIPFTTTARLILFWFTYIWNGADYAENFRVQLAV